MEKVLKKYISNNISDDLIKEITDKVLVLKNKSDNFESLIKEKRITLNSNTLDAFYDFLRSFQKIYDEIDTAEFLKAIENSSSGLEVAFWNSIINYFSFNKTVKNQTAFLREMDMLDFEELILYTFNTNILHNGFIKEYKKWSKEEVKTAEKTINTFLYCMIDNFNDFNVTLQDLDIRFHFGEEKYKYIWNLCEKNKIFLMLKNITERLTAISNIDVVQNEE